jgi:hypothetical protein
MKSPMVFNNFLEKPDFIDLQGYIKGLDFSNDFNRYEFGGEEIMNNLHKKLIPIAKKFFESETLVPSFNFGSWYFGEASLEKHKDVAACTYSIDLCIYQKESWDLYIEGTPYALNENDAVLYYGEEQRHWREAFPNPKNNVVCNVFFFFIEPTHWFLAEPKEKHEDIRRKNAFERNMSYNEV